MATFSTALNSGSRWWNWKTNPTCRFRNATRASSPAVDSSVPAIVMRPPSMASSPPTQCSSVLFPTPEAPTTAIISPSSTASSRSRRTESRRSPTT